jgi:hypothetical protein
MKHITCVITFRLLIKKIHTTACEVFARIRSFSYSISSLYLSVWLVLVIRVLLSTDIPIRKYLVETFLMNENWPYFVCNGILKIEIYSLQYTLNGNFKTIYIFIRYTLVRPTLSTVKKAAFKVQLLSWALIKSMTLSFPNDTPWGT